MNKKGIDISYWQGNIDFNKIKNDGIEFVILREGYRQTIDKKFKEYVDEFTKVGLPIVGVYHFIYALNESDALAEAKSCIKNIQDAGLSKDVIVFADFEYDTITNAKKNGITLGSKQCNLFTKIFCEYVESQGYKAGIYSNIDYYKNMYDKDLLAKYIFWLADYEGEPNYPCTFRQYSSKGKVNGINGNVDMDYQYKEVQEGDNMANTVDKVIKVAEAEIGYLEKKNGDTKYLYEKTANAGSANYTKYGKEMHEIYPAVMDYPAYWCDCFVDWCFQKAYGISTAKSLIGGNFDDYTVNSAQMYKNKGAYYKKNPQVGDQIFFNNGTRICHTGIVYKVDSSKVYTIEGNTSGASGVVANGGGVAKKSYSLTYARIDGYGRPKYDKNSSTTQTTSGGLNKTPKWTGKVTASELNIRKGAGTQFANLTSYPRLKKGTTVGVCDSMKASNGDTWYYIKISGSKGAKYGFAHSKYITKA